MAGELSVEQGKVVEISLQIVFEFPPEQNAVFAA
jgi:hypothetical protein